MNEKERIMGLTIIVLIGALIISNMWQITKRKIMEIGLQHEERWSVDVEETDYVDKEPIPQWFVDEFNQTFIGSYSVQIEDDKLNFVIITTDKQFYDLRQFIEGDNHNWQGGYMGTDTDIDLMEWDYVVKPETDDGKTYGIIHPGATTEGDAE